MVPVRLGINWGKIRAANLTGKKKKILPDLQKT